jgi:hypothetical protein
MDKEGKAFSPSYRESAFCFSPETQAGYRLVAWSPFIEQTKALFYESVDAFTEEIRILLKFRDPEVESENTEDADWTRYVGQARKEEFLSSIRNHEEVVFKDGYSQLCVREGEYSDYFAFDEHGIFFFYSHNPAFRQICEKLGFEQRSAEPIYSVHHFQRQIPDLQEKRLSLIADLVLKPVQNTP